MPFAKPKLGFLFLTAGWFIDIGASQGAFSELPHRLRENAEEVERALGEEVEVVTSGVLAERAGVGEAMERFHRDGVEGVVICPLTWCEDALILEVVENLRGLPMLLWCYLPERALPPQMSMVDLFHGSGPVAALQVSGPLKRLGAQFSTVFGSRLNPETIRRVIAFARAAHVAKLLKSARIGMLPHRCEVMPGTWVDDDRLRNEIGPEVHYISLVEYKAICDAIPEERVALFVSELTTAYPSAPSLTAEGLRRGARVSLGMAEVAERYCLDAIAIEDICEETHRALGLRPCLFVPELFKRAVVSMEAEVGGAVALLILRGLTGLPVMYTEIFAADETENTVLAGHAGMMDIRLAGGEVVLEPDGEYAESEPDSAWMRFQAKPGRVTLLCIFQDVERFKLIVTTGEALGGPQKLLGSPSAYIRLDTPLPEFFTRCMRTGMTQHWALVHAEVAEEVGMLAEILGAEYMLL
jgi:L-arabinose isomerase